MWCVSVCISQPIRKASVLMFGRSYVLYAALALFSYMCMVPEHEEDMEILRTIKLDKTGDLLGTKQEGWQLAVYTQIANSRS